MKDHFWRKGSDAGEIPMLFNGGLFLKEGRKDTGEIPMLFQGGLFLKELKHTEVRYLNFRKEIYWELTPICLYCKQLRYKQYRFTCLWVI